MKTPPFPDKRYDVIYADPPWQQQGSFFHNHRVNQSDKNINSYYETMSRTELEALSVNSIMNDDCLLFLWTTGINLTDAIVLGQSWGFEYKTIAFVWYKDRPVVATYVLNDCELCLLFKHGKIPQPRGKRNIRQFLQCKPSGHSSKPDEVRHRITEMFPTQAKIELFARVNDRLFPPQEGWDYWGLEA